MKSIILIFALLFVTDTFAAKKNLDLEALRVEYDNFVADKKYKKYAKAEKLVAKQTIEQIYQRKGKVKQHAVYMARHKLAFAKLTAESEVLSEKLSEAEEVYSQLQIEMLKAEAAVARLDADKSRLLLSLGAEEAERATLAKQQALALVQETNRQKNQTQAELDAAKKYAKAQAEEADLARQEADLAFEEIEALRRQLESLAARETVDGLVMTLGDFVFDSASANIKQTAVDNFEKVLEFIDGYPGKKIRIEGHTDSSGSAQFNLNLSQRRADAVKVLLVDFSVESGLIDSVGMGEEFPVADNTSEAGKAKNRRVDIIILN
ncbi:MAG: OmpA family protein [Proteobacteria bacterium]|nr:OmpA family protein [Pseudomonadota bacterium]